MRKILFFFTCALLTIQLKANDSTKVVLKTFTPDPQHGVQFQLIGQMLNSFHYRKLTIDDKLSEEFLNNYIENLDKEYFKRLEIGRAHV